MDNEFVQVIRQEMELTDEEAAFINEHMPVRHLKKGTTILAEGQVAHESYYNLKGLVRLYYLVDGEERTTALYTEGEPICSYDSYINKVPAKHYLQCIEDTMLAVVSFDIEQEMYKRFPKFEAMCRVNTEHVFGQHQEHLASYITMTPEERYLKLLDNRPELLNRVPQYHLASYLGIKPESLSRIRKRVALKIS